MLADLDSLEKRVDNLSKKAKGNDKDAKEQLDLVNRALVLLRDGKPRGFSKRKPEGVRSACLDYADLKTGARLQRRGRFGQGRQQLSRQVFEHARRMRSRW